MLVKTVVKWVLCCLSLVVESSTISTQTLGCVDGVGGTWQLGNRSGMFCAHFAVDEAVTVRRGELFSSIVMEGRAWQMLDAPVLTRWKI